jgi:hypothetical protein
MYFSMTPYLAASPTYVAVTPQRPYLGTMLPVDVAEPLHAPIPAAKRLPSPGSPYYQLLYRLTSLLLFNISTHRLDASPVFHNLLGNHLYGV